MSKLTTLDLKNNQTHKPVEEDFYLVLTRNKKWAIAWWDGTKWWDDSHQDGALKFGIRDDWIMYWEFLPEKPEWEDEND